MWDLVLVRKLPMDLIPQDCDIRPEQMKFVKLRSPLRPRTSTISYQYNLLENLQVNLFLELSLCDFKNNITPPFNAKPTFLDFYQLLVYIVFCQTLLVIKQEDEELKKRLYNTINHFNHIVPYPCNVDYYQGIRDIWIYIYA